MNHPVCDVFFRKLGGSWVLGLPGKEPVVPTFSAEQRAAIFNDKMPREPKPPGWVPEQAKQKDSELKLQKKDNDSLRQQLNFIL